MHKRKHFRRGILGDTISYTYLTILALLAAFPLFWILVSSVKSKGELTANPTAIFPQVFSLEYYKIVFEQLKFGTNIMNSVVVAGSTTIIAILISALGAYGVVRFFPRFGKIMTRVLITTYMFPPILARDSIFNHYGQSRAGEQPRWTDYCVSFDFCPICDLAFGWILPNSPA